MHAIERLFDPPPSSPLERDAAGVLPVYMRDLSAETTTIRKWLMFDGPVDAVRVHCDTYHCLF